jgi:CoA:oxalate CoA-transferase
MSSTQRPEPGLPDEPLAPHRTSPHQLRQPAMINASALAAQSSAQISRADLPLAGMTVLDFSQFLSGPVAALRLYDLGARVIKIERPGVGDLGRTLSFRGLRYQGDTLSFHAMNRGKESVVANLKSDEDLAAVHRLVSSADVLVANFRPGVMERLGLDYESLRALNPRLVYGSVSGYGDRGPWRGRPGQDLLAQASSGLTWLSGDDSQGPVPVGVSLADHLASIHLAHGITALLLRRERTGAGGLVETSLLEGLLDLQLEMLTAHFSAGAAATERGGPNSASPFIDAPYGVYQTADGYLAVAMNPVPKIGALLGIPALEVFADPERWWDDREQFRALLATGLSTQTTAHWLSLLEPADVWCAPVLSLAELAETEAFEALAMMQPIVPSTGENRDDFVLRTTRSPLRIDGAVLTSDVGAPRLGQDTNTVLDDAKSSAGVRTTP